MSKRRPTDSTLRPPPLPTLTVDIAPPTLAAIVAAEVARATRRLWVGMFVGTCLGTMAATAMMILARRWGWLPP